MRSYAHAQRAAASVSRHVHTQHSNLSAHFTCQCIFLKPNKQREEEKRESKMLSNLNARSSNTHFVLIGHTNTQRHSCAHKINRNTPATRSNLNCLSHAHHRVRICRQLSKREIVFAEVILRTHRLVESVYAYFSNAFFHLSVYLSIHLSITVRIHSCCWKFFKLGRYPRTFTVIWKSPNRKIFLVAASRIDELHS